MAIDINEVYQTVLYVLNKEQRGYIPPAEFNKIAEQSQLTIFEKYFQDLNQALRMPDNDSEYANRVKNIQEKIDIFAREKNLNAAKKFSVLDPPMHRLGTLEYTPYPLNGEVPVELAEMTRHDFNLAIRSKLTRPTKSYPAFTIQHDEIITYPKDLSGEQITVYYVTKPKKPEWNYSLGQVGNYVFTPPGSTTTLNPSVDFEISSEDQVELINTILTYCGIIIRDQQIIQSAASMVMQENQNEKS